MMPPGGDCRPTNQGAPVELLSDERGKVARSAVLGLAASAVLLLASCGGGGGGTPGVSSAPPDPSSGLAASSSVAQHCAAPRNNGTDVQGTVADEKSWLRSWTDETYLWYQDVRALGATTLNPLIYATPEDYFKVLQTPIVTASGKPKDAYHFTYDTPTWIALSRNAVSYGYGFEISLVASRPPRQAIVAYTNPSTAAAMAGIVRGAQVLTVDGVDLANGTDLATLNAGLFPTAAGLHTFSVLDPGASAARSVTLNSLPLVSATVQNVKTLPAPNQNVGYMQFNDHLATSEAELVAAINQLKASSITDLVLDMRYNGGGYLDIAAELAYMIAGAGPTPGSRKVFEQQTFNDKNPFQLSAAQTITPFHNVAQGFSVSAGQALPTLNLSRVYVLAGADTCSASEAVVNGLRGVGVQVNLIGATTCGKPYGFYPQDNCGTTYFSIQFSGVNQLGLGDYADGFAPTCAAGDDFTHALGDPSEGQLAAALSYRANSRCAPGMALAQAARATGALAGAPVLVRPPLRENRIYRSR